MNYDEVAKAVAQYIKLDDPMKLRFYINNNTEYIERKEDLKLNQLVSNARYTNNSSSNTLLYEIQDIAITEMEVKKFIHVKFLNKHHQVQKIIDY